MAPTPTRLSVVLRQLRTSKGLTQLQVAEKAGLSVGMVTQVELGGRSLSADSLAAVADALGATKAERAALEEARVADKAGSRQGLAAVKPGARSIDGLSELEYQALVAVLRVMRDGRG